MVRRGAKGRGSESPVVASLSIPKQTTSPMLCSTFCVHGVEGEELISPVVSLEFMNKKKGNRETLILNFTYPTKWP